MKGSPLPVHKTIGKLPAMWDRSGIFCVNLASLFFGNTAEIEVLYREIGTIESYGGRLLPVLNLIFKGSENLLLLEREPEPSLMEYFRDVLNIGLPEVQVIPSVMYPQLLKGENREVREMLGLVADHPAEWMDAFVTDSTLVRLAKLTGKRLISSPDGSKRGNNKVLLHEHLEASGLPVFDTFLAETPDKVPELTGILRNMGYRRVVIKAQIGASGIGMVKLDVEETSECPAYLFYEGRCLVQGWLDDCIPGVRFLGSPSVQLFVHDKAVSLHDLTEQLLDGESVHQGNLSPPLYLVDDTQTYDEILRQAQVGGEWLHQQGYRGNASVDFHVIERNGSREVRICEINARVTGATYPTLLAGHFMPGGAWVMRNIYFSTPARGQVILEELDRAGLLYRPGGGAGILPINFNFDRGSKIAKGQFLAFGRTAEEVQLLLEHVGNLKALPSEYGRD
ncbi:MAG: hypothetical protein WD490_04690 [Opitutales bacterium]